MVRVKSGQPGSLIKVEERKCLFGCAVFEEIERARRGDYSGVSEGRRVD